MKKITHISLSLLLITLTSSTAFAQLKEPRYLIYKTPIVVGQRIMDSLNRVIGYMKDEDDVFETIDKRLSSFHNLVIHIKKTYNAKTDEFIDYYIGEPQKSIRNFRGKTGSMSAESQIIRFRSQLKSFFPDTLFVIDTLKLNLQPTDFHYPLKGYYLRTSVNGRKIDVPFIVKGTQLFCIIQPFFGATPKLCKLHSSKSQLPLATFHLAFVNESQKLTLLSIMRLLKDNNLNNPDLTVEAISSYLQSYGELMIGYIKQKNIDDWLRNTK